MNFEKRISLILDGALLLLFLLSARLVYWQLVRADLLAVALDPGGFNSQGLKQWARDTGELERLLKGDEPLHNLESLPRPVVQRVSDVLETITRGQIYDRSGRLLAVDRKDEAGNRYRYYMEPSLAHVIGQVSGLGVGITGLERQYNQKLLGLDRLDVGFKRMVHDPIAGSNLVLTIDAGLQETVEAALGDKAGSILVLDGQSGAVLALASAPRYDPNRMLEAGYLAGLVEDCGGTAGGGTASAGTASGEAADCSGIFLNRATQALYPPGSTWKTVTLIAALDTGQVKPGQVFDFGKPVQGPNGPYYVYQVDGGVIPDPNHREAKLPLDLAYAKSANAAFARIGAEMPAETFIDYARRFGFSQPEGERPRIPFELAPSQAAQDVDSLISNNLLRAATAIGQGELLVTPMQMGMLVLAVLNDGNLPVPYFVESVRDPTNERILQGAPREQALGLMKPETARLVREMMQTNVTEGSARPAAVKGLTVGGKTGTAQLGGDQAPHAWFTGFAQKGERSVVIVVMIEHGGEGSRVAAPLFAQVAGPALQAPAQPDEQVTPEPTATPLPPTPQPDQAAPTQAAPVAGRPTPTSAAPAATSIPGIPLPDIPFREGQVDITETGSATCPGDHEPVVGSGEFTWPSKYQALSGGDFREGHPGVDLSAPEGSAVYAADAGLVLFAGWSGVGYGNVIVIDHGNGYRSLYGHLAQVSQYCGARVKKGQYIGSSGSTGNSSGPHLHFEVRVPGGYLNPLKVLPIP